ncbi:MAG: PEP-CTERM sorting domain-containing protein [Verrucomicrobiales bacterium]
MASCLAGYLSSPVLTDVKLNFDGWKVSDLEPAVLPDLFADRPHHDRELSPRHPPLRSRSPVFQETDGSLCRSMSPRQSKKPEPQERIGKKSPLLWARTRIARLDDYAHLGEAETVRGEVTALGLKYGLTTRFTSFVAVDTQVRPAPSLTGHTVKQPLPLPAGVPTSAVGGTAGGTTPEPGLLTLLFGGLAAWWARRRRQSTQA